MSTDVNLHILSDGGSIALGVLVGLLSACIQSVGLTLQRKSHILEDDMEEEYGYTRRPPYKRRRWQLGMFMFLVANIVGSTIQITTLPLPVLSTLQASGLVFNTACATLLLHEPFTKFSVIGTSLVAAGAVLIALFGAMSEPSHNLDQLLILLGHPQFLIWLISSFVVVFVIIIVIFFQERILTRNNHRARLLLGLAYGSVSGILSAHTLLLAKSAVELLIRTIVDRINQFNRWQSWMILLGLVFLALSQLYLLNRGLRLCSTSVLYPFVFCVYNIVAILDGLIYFRQTSRITVLHACLVALGTIVLLLGVFALSWRLGPDYQSSTSPEADTKVNARVQVPHTPLAPGLGLAHTELPTESQDVSGQSSRANETTPLLRSKTSPTPNANTKNSLFRPSRKRRITITEEPNDLWDELNNDRNEGHRFSGQFSPQQSRSPSSSKLRPSTRKPRSVSLLSRIPSVGNAAANIFSVSRLPSWSRNGAAVSEEAIPPHEVGDIGDNTGPESSRTRGYHASESSTGDNQAWFQLRWWTKGKRKWWNDEENNDQSA